MRSLVTVRAAAAAIVVAGVLAPVVVGAKAKGARGPARYAFAPYIDMTLYPAPDLPAIARASGVREISLGFVTARGGGACAPAWGGYAADPASGTGAYRSANIAAFKRAGGAVVPSFGGQAGTELAAVCPTAAALERAYARVLATYRPRRIDFDIEGAGVRDRAAIARRSAAIAALQRRHRGLRVSFTLPVNPSGLDGDGLHVLRSAISHDVTIAYVNVMTMDYGDSAAPHPRGRMGAYAIDAARSVARQLHRLYPGRGAARRMRMIGVTPMIGINDVSSERFTVADAGQLASFARGNRLGMLSMWQLGRDHPCPRPVVQTQLTCSGVPQADYQFARTFGP